MFRNLGCTLALVRELRCQSQGAVASRAGIGKSQLSKYERGKELPKLESLEKVLTVLEVGVDGFFYMLSAVDSWAADLEKEGKKRTDPVPRMAVIPRLPGTGFPEVDQAFRVTLTDLLVLHRSMLEVLLRPVAAGRSRE